MTDTPSTSTPAGTERTRILIYCGAVIVALHFLNPSSGFQVIPFSFVLKNKLHLTANGLATFALWASVPAYLSFAFGIVRDFWSPFGLGDRGYLILFAGLAAIIDIVFAFLPLSLAMLLISSLAGTSCFLFLWSAWNGLGSTIGQQLSMSGRISSLWNFGATLTVFAALAFGGVLSDWLELQSAGDAVRVLFLLLAAVMAAIAALGLWKPDAVYAHLHRAR